VRTKRAFEPLPFDANPYRLKIPGDRLMDVDIKDLSSLIGKEIGVSDWVEISQERVNLFAEATGDHQWIHVDVERATKEIGGPIAHGYLTLSLIPFLSAGMLNVKGVVRGINYGSDKVRFTNMVRVGKKVRMRQKLIGAEPKAGGMQIKNECTIEIEGEDRPACVAETISVIYTA
jgi:acyl dehydratase